MSRTQPSNPPTDRTGPKEESDDFAGTRDLSSTAGRLVTYKVRNPATGAGIVSGVVVPLPEDEKEWMVESVPPLADTHTLPIPDDTNAHLHDSFTVADFRQFPPLEWMVDGLFHEGSVVMVWGASGSGKTAWLIDVVLSVVSGQKWAGRKVRKANVLYGAMEGAQGFRERVIAAVDARGLEIGAGLRTIFEPIDLSRSEHIHGLALHATQNQVGLIVIDTLAAALAGELDENSNRHMAELIGNARRLSWMTGATVLLTHHTGHDKRHERGATALRGGMDTSIGIFRDKKTGRRHWELVKQRDGTEGFGGYFELVPHTILGTNGQPSISVVARQLEGFGAEDAPSSHQGGKVRKSKAVAGEGSGEARSQSQPKPLSATQQTVWRELQALWQERTATSSMTENETLALPEQEAIKRCSPKLQDIRAGNRTRAVRVAFKALTDRGIVKLHPDGGLILVSLNELENVNPSLPPSSPN